MRRFVIYTLLVILTLGTLWRFDIIPFGNVCDSPIEYSVNQVDSEFNLSEAEFRSAILEAEEVWESELDRELFKYDPDADFAINLIFDERQRETQEAERLKSELDNTRREHVELEDRYREASELYESERAEFLKMRSDFETALSNYNSKVQEWNEKGGAPPEVIDELNDESRMLEDMRTALDAKRSEVNELVSSLNRLGAEGEEIRYEYNEKADTYADRYGGEREFNQGRYIGDAINIYQFNERNDLVLVLVHEFGHALGIDHVANPESVMNAVMKEQNLEDISLSGEDIGALYEVCRVK